MDYLKTIAKAVTAVAAVIVAGITAGQLPIDEAWVVIIQAIVAGIGVWAVPNS